jgi:hypothetical protein
MPTPMGKGVWWVHSDEDERWNSAGTSSEVGLEYAGPEAHRWIQECRMRYAKQPDDLQIGYYFTD